MGDAVILRTSRGGTIVSFYNEDGNVLIWAARMIFVPPVASEIGHLSTGDPPTWWKVEKIVTEFNYEEADPETETPLSRYGVAVFVSAIV